MAREYKQLLSRSLLIGLLVAAVGLSGCGRKGPLDPPSASVKSDAAADGMITTDETSKAAPQKPNRPFALDPLIR